MKIPCKECIAYASCQYRSIWDLIDICPRFKLYVRLRHRNCDRIAAPWTRSLRSFQKNGEL